MSDRTDRGRLLLPFALAWSVIVLGVVEWTSGTGAFRPFLALADPRVGPAGFGALVTHAILCEDDRRKRLVLRFGVVLETLRYFFLLHSGVSIEVLSFSVGYGFFAAAVVDFLIHREWRSAALAALVPIGMAIAPLGLAGIVYRHTPLTYDGALMGFDDALRFPFSKLTASLLAKVPAIRALTLLAYTALPGSIAAGLAYEEYTRRKNLRRGVGVNLLLAYTIGGTIAAILYMICPATGPSHAFRDLFPQHLPDAAHVPLVLHAFAPESPRNAMPSFHVCWAVLLARSTAGARPALRMIAWLSALFTIGATIGTGEHYVFDLIATAPFLIALEAATATRSMAFFRRMSAIVVGLVVYFSWIAAIRNAPQTLPTLLASPLLLWFLVIATLMLSAFFALRFQRLSVRSTCVGAFPET